MAEESWEKMGFAHFAHQRQTKRSKVDNFVWLWVKRCTCVYQVIVCPQAWKCLPRYLCVCVCVCRWMWMPVIYKPFNGILFSAWLQINLTDQDTEHTSMFPPWSIASSGRTASPANTHTHTHTHTHTSCDSPSQTDHTLNWAECF